MAASVRLHFCCHLVKLQVHGLHYRTEIEQSQATELPIVPNHTDKNSFRETERHEGVLCKFIRLSAATQCNNAMNSPECFAGGSKSLRETSCHKPNLAPDAPRTEKELDRAITRHRKSATGKSRCTKQWEGVRCSSTNIPIAGLRTLTSLLASQRRKHRESISRSRRTNSRACTIE
jgi:hypothetical protein